MNKIKGLLDETIEINLADAQHLVKAFQDSGDRVNLEKALEDLHKWEQKKAEQQKVQS